jgi:hypothetical protein
MIFVPTFLKCHVFKLLFLVPFTRLQTSKKCIVRVYYMLLVVYVLSLSFFVYVSMFCERPYPCEHCHLSRLTKIYVCFCPRLVLLVDIFIFPYIYCALYVATKSFISRYVTRLSIYHHHRSSFFPLSSFTSAFLYFDQKSLV